MELTEFLLARIDEDEAVARAADKSRWFPEGKSISFEIHNNVGEWDLVGWVEADTRANANHIARHDPAHVLAECQAKRRIIERVGNPNWAGFNNLALPYTDHPDYRQEWTP